MTRSGHFVLSRVCGLVSIHVYLHVVNSVDFDIWALIGFGSLPEGAVVMSGVGDQPQHRGARTVGKFSLGQMLQSR